MHLHVHRRQPGLDLRVLEDCRELLLVEATVAGSVGDCEEVLHLGRIGAIRGELLPDHHLSVVRCQLHRLADEDRGHDPEHGKGDRCDIQDEKQDPPSAEVIHQSPGVVRPAAAEGELEDGVVGPRRRAVEVVGPLPCCQRHIRVDKAGVYRLCDEEGRAQHDQGEEHHRPEHGHETRGHRRDQHPELAEDAAGLVDPQCPQQPQKPQRAQEGQVEARRRGEHVGGVQVDADGDHDGRVEHVPPLPGGLVKKEALPQHGEPDEDLGQEYGHEPRLGDSHGVAQIAGLPGRLQAQVGTDGQAGDLQVREQQDRICHDQRADGLLHQCPQLCPPSCLRLGQTRHVLQAMQRYQAFDGLPVLGLRPSETLSRRGRRLLL
mmetsp:Transcript_106517/g.306244  ORF Transcript_106517/g.306244 Transcript_106517/m.306244 type:complete len:376 (-) Transcript_106517:54-1181(-)